LAIRYCRRFTKVDYLHKKSHVYHRTELFESAVEAKAITNIVCASRSS
jgi:hypothetical protein